MNSPLKKISKVLTYGLFVVATLLVGLLSGSSRDHKISSGFSLPSIPTAYADVPPVGSGGGSAGCAGSGDGCGEGGEGDDGGGEGGGSSGGSSGGGGGDAGGGADGSDGSD